MAMRHSQICNITPTQLTCILKDQLRNARVRLIDCRSFLEYNDNHVVGAVNICCSKLIKRRLQQEKISVNDLLVHCRIEVEGASDVIVYDQKSTAADDVTCDTFISILLKKLAVVFENVYVLSGGFASFQSLFPDLCENKIWKFPGLSTLSQPCLQATSSGPTRILSFLYLGSEEDANNKEILQSHNIKYELNVSNKCPKPEFMSEGHFLRIPCDDSHNEKLIPHFGDTYQFIEKVRGSNESVLVHCLAGISRSPTVAIAYVMRHLQMTYEDAYRYVKSKRATISPNFNFLGQLMEYEKQLISEKILEPKKLAPPCPYPPSQSLTSDLFLGPNSPPAAKTEGKRLNLSLRLCPYSSTASGRSSSKDASPTTAMARLQFEKPFGKENRTGIPGGSSPTLQCPVGLGFSLTRPTRLAKEQNVSCIKEETADTCESLNKTVTKQSLSISFSKSYKSRKCSNTDDQQQPGCSASTSGEGPSDQDLQENFSSNKKFRLHKIYLETENSTAVPDKLALDLPFLPLSEAAGSGSAIDENAASGLDGLVTSPLGGLRRDYFRSDSVSTSGIGSEISDHDLQASGSWDITESGSSQEVFPDNYNYSKSPKFARQTPLWSSDSGHWSPTDEGVASCSSSTIEVPSVGDIIEEKSPEKRKCPDNLFPYSRLSLANLEKRKSYASGDNSTIELGRSEHSRASKRWSLAESTNEYSGLSAGPSGSGGCATIVKSAEDLYAEDGTKMDVSRIGFGSRGSSSSSGSHLNFGPHWVSLLSGEELTCCERPGESAGNGLFRVHSCPGIVGYRDWVHLHNQVPESPPEPISDSVLLKMRSCRNRTKHQKAFDHHAVNSTSKNRFSSGSLDYGELWSKLKIVQDSNADPASHSSSSTLASSSFSIAVQ